MTTPEQRLLLVAQNAPVYTLRPKLDTSYATACVTGWQDLLMLAQIESESSIPDNMLWNLLFVPHFNGFIMVNRATNLSPQPGGLGSSVSVNVIDPEYLSADNSWRLTGRNTEGGYVGVQTLLNVDYALQVANGTVTTSNPVCTSKWSANDDSMLWVFKPVTKPS